MISRLSCFIFLCLGTLLVVNFASAAESEISPGGTPSAAKEECVDTAPVGETQCKEWAWHGECDNNPKYMHTQCRKSCKICESEEEEEEKCEDILDECEGWAADGLCFGLWSGERGGHIINNAFLVDFCPKSCGVCDIHLDVRDFGLLMGFPQTLPDPEAPHMRQRVVAKVQETRKYIEGLDPEIAKVCRFGHINCARMTLSKDSCEENADHYVYKYLCAAGCETCEKFSDPAEKEEALKHYKEAIDDYKSYAERQRLKAGMENTMMG